jgi:hypothetical protein
MQLTNAFLCPLPSSPVTPVSRVSRHALGPGLPPRPCPNSPPRLVPGLVCATPRRFPNSVFYRSPVRSARRSKGVKRCEGQWGWMTSASQFRRPASRQSSIFDSIRSCWTRKRPPIKSSRMITTPAKLAVCRSTACRLALSSAHGRCLYKDPLPPDRRPIRTLRHSTEARQECGLVRRISIGVAEHHGKGKALAWKV